MIHIKVDPREFFLNQDFEFYTGELVHLAEICENVFISSPYIHYLYDMYKEFHLYFG